MEENHDKEKEELYAKAFNQGYYLQRFEPDLAAQIGEGPVSNIYIQTFNDGRDAYIDELKERLHDYQKDMPIPSKDKDRGMEHDR